MKIFILNPNFNLEKKAIMPVRSRQPLSLAIIASILRQDGNKIELLDANVLGYFNNQIIKKIKDFQPEVLILTSTPIDRWECPNVYIDNIFKIIKRVNVKYKILTGSHGTIMPEWVFKKSKVDIIIREEPELVIKELIKAIKAGKHLKDINGLSWRHGNEIINNQNAIRIEDLDFLPLPAYDLLPMKEYGFSGLDRPFSIMMTSRGCPYNCTFCLKVMSDGKYIAQSPKRTIKEISYLIETFKIKSIYFQDWEFLILPDRVRDICNLILGQQFKFSWGCNARADDIIKNSGLISLMKNAGCVRINIGLESASDVILSNIRKGFNKNDLQKAIDILKPNNIIVGFYTLLNCPGENKSTIKETVNFISKNNIKVKKINFAVPYPGTQLFKKLKKQYPDKNFDWDNIEDYAGYVDVKISPRKALFYLRHYKFQKKYGRFYFLNLYFWFNLLKKGLI